MKKKNTKILVFGLYAVAVILVIIGIFLIRSAMTPKTSNTGLSASKISKQYKAKDSVGEELETTEIKKEGVYHLSGEYSCIYINASGDVQLNLENATISCTTGPAIYVEDADAVYITLTGENTISATTTDELDGAIYSTDDLIFSGEGSLKVTSNYDGIVSKDTLIIQSGNYTVEADDDGIRGKDNISITEGTFKITSKEDGIKSTNEEESGMGTIAIDGGTFTINAGDDGIHAVGSLDINNGTFEINAVEGLEGSIVRINDGTINITSSDDGINASQKSSYYTTGTEIHGGNITITMGRGDTDAIDSNGYLTITGGTINIIGQSSFDYDGELTYTGGTIIVNGVTTNTVTNQMMGGGPMGGGPGGRGR